MVVLEVDRLQRVYFSGLACDGCIGGGVWRCRAVESGEWRRVEGEEF